MDTFIEKNRRLLKIYCITARILGWILLVAGPFWVICLLGGKKINVEAAGTNVLANTILADIILNTMSSLIFDFLLAGLVALGVSQFIRYLSETQPRPGPLVRNADRILYIYAAFLILKTPYSYAWRVHVKYAQVIEESNAWMLFLQPYILPTIVKVLILVGLGIVLKRLIPVIEESRTLV